MTKITSRKEKRNIDKLIIKKHKKHKINKDEFELTSMVLKALNVEIEYDFSLTMYGYDIYMGSKLLSFPEYFQDLDKLDKYQTLFRPFSDEKHANMLIDMFECVFDKQIEHLEITNNETGGYNGYFVSDGEKLKDTEVFSIDSTLLVKSACVAKAIMKKKEFSKFISKLVYFMKAGD